MAERAEEFDMIVQGRRVGWWAAEALPFTYTPEPTPKHPTPPQFTCNFHPYTIFGTPAPVTWNGPYLQFCHHQPGQRNPIPERAKQKRKRTVSHCADAGLRRPSFIVCQKKARNMTIRRKQLFQATLGKKGSKHPRISLTENNLLVAEGGVWSWLTLASPSSSAQRPRDNLLAPPLYGPWGSCFPRSLARCVLVLLCLVLTAEPPLYIVPSLSSISDVTLASAGGFENCRCKTCAE